MQATNGPAEVGLLLSQLEFELAAALTYGQRLLDQLLVEWHRYSLLSRDGRRNPDRRPVGVSILQERPPQSEGARVALHDVRRPVGVPQQLEVLLDRRDAPP